MTRLFSLSPRLLLVAAHAITVIIGAISVGGYLVVFPPHFRGWPEIRPDKTVAGWAVNEAAPMTSVEVQLYIDNHFIADRIADLSRPDVVAAGRAEHDKCGFKFDLPPLEKGEHEAQVYVAHEVGAGGVYRTLQRIGKPLRFSVP